VSLTLRDWNCGIVGGFVGLGVGLLYGLLVRG
jgi:hypothetical protein